MEAGDVRWAGSGCRAAGAAVVAMVAVGVRPAAMALMVVVGAAVVAVVAAREGLDG